MGIIKRPDGCSEVQAGNADASGYVMGKGDSVAVSLFKSDLAATEAFVLIDLSDSASFPHSSVGLIRLYNLHLFCEKATDGQFKIHIGVITEIDAADGSAHFFWTLPVEWVLNPTDSTDARQFSIHYPYGLNLEVNTVDEDLEYLLTNDIEAANARWQTGTALDSPKGDTSSAPGVGDLVMLVELTGAGTITLSVTVEYTSES